MVSSGSVNAVASELSSKFSTYKSLISEMSSSWKGASYDNLSSKAEEFVSEFESAIIDQLSSFADAVTQYEQYKLAKTNLEISKTNQKTAIINNDSFSISKYAADVVNYQQEMNSLEEKIKTSLQAASNPILEAKSTNASNATSTTGATNATSASNAAGATNTKGEFVNYYQTDYPNVKYSDYGTIKTYGCGPTALAMVLTHLLDEEITPIETAEKGYNSKANYTCASGTYWSYFGAMADEYGVSCDQMEVSKSNVLNNLNADKTLIMSMGPGHFTKRGHFIVVRGLDENGKVIVADPASKKRSDQTWDLNIILDESTQMWSMDR